MSPDNGKKTTNIYRSFTPIIECKHRQHSANSWIVSKQVFLATMYFVNQLQNVFYEPRFHKMPKLINANAILEKFASLFKYFDAFSLIDY